MPAGSLSIPLGELDFLGLIWLPLFSPPSQLSIPLGELDFLGPGDLTKVERKAINFQFPLGN